MIEEITRFDDAHLVGLVYRPDGLPTSSMPGIVMLSPGLMHRVGPNRLYVKIARALAADGLSVLRFDFSGIGDSGPRTDNLPIERSAIAEARVAVGHLMERVGCDRVILIGHCSGALISLATAFDDDRVAGVVAISPEGGDEGWVEFDRRQKEARYYANYYTRGALGDRGRWQRFLTGKTNYANIASNLFRGVIANRIAARVYRYRSATGAAAIDAEERPEVRAFKQGLHSLAERRLPILLVHPDQSAGPELMRAVLGTAIDDMHVSGNLQIGHIAESDHMFTPLAAQRALIQTIREWLSSNAVARPVPIATAVNAP